MTFSNSLYVSSREIVLLSMYIYKTLNLTKQLFVLIFAIFIFLYMLISHWRNYTCSKLYEIIKFDIKGIC